VKDEIRLLLDLQEADRRGEELDARVEELQAERARLEARLARERDAVGEIREDLETLRRDSRDRNLSVDELDLKIRGYRTQLEKGIISFKEMEALRMKIAQEHEHMNTLEDEALRLMDEIETAAVRLDEAGEKLARREEKLSADCEAIDQRVAEARKEIEACRKERDAIAAKVPEHLLSRYEHLRAEYVDPVVEVEDGSCGGCNLAVSGTTVDRILTDLEVVSCENCSRILYMR